MAKVHKDYELDKRGTGELRLLTQFVEKGIELLKEEYEGTEFQLLLDEQVEFMEEQLEMLHEELEKRPPVVVGMKPASLTGKVP